MSLPQDALLTPAYLGGPAITGENCDREAIHLPGSIQPHGALLVLEADLLTVLQVSENIQEFLGLAVPEVLGQGVARLLGPQVEQDLILALPAGTPDRLQFRTRLSTFPQPLTMTAHRSGERLILEIEHLPQDVTDSSNRLRNAVFTLESAGSLPELLNAAVTAARDLSGFDRVMLYRFLADNSGVVEAESCRPDLLPFLGHRFPESDIPAQARALYLRHMLRLTADVNAVPAPLVPRVDPLTQAPTLLGGAVLRATSPMHLQYLRNMGVASSLSVSIVAGGRLWGLISCHHTAPQVTPPGVRSALEELGRLLNVQVQLKEQTDVAAFRAQLAAGHHHILNTVSRTLTPLATLSDPALGLMELLGASGLALRLEGEWRTLGDVPAPDDLALLLDWLREHQPEVLFATDYLAGAWPQAADLTDCASGVLAVSLGRGWQESVLWFRAEEQQVAVWGGATPQDAHTELGPRQSFATYVEQVRGHGRPWHPGEVAEAQAISENLSAALGERLSTLRKLNDDLARSNEEWRKFAFVIAHDMQEPVRLIRQFMELFSLRQKNQVDEQTRKLMDFLTAETTRVGSLTTDLYAYTELLSYPELHLEHVKLHDLLERSLTELRPLAEQKQLVWHAPAQNPTLYVDAHRMQLALTHVLRNALLFGTAPVEIEVQAHEGAQHLTLSIQDNGPGIPKPYQERVFELFQRLSPREAAGGNGVGLTLARKVAELHGGSLLLSSAPAAGTTLTFTLPSQAHQGIL